MSARTLPGPKYRPIVPTITLAPRTTVRSPHVITSRRPPIVRPNN